METLESCDHGNRELLDRVLGSYSTVENLRFMQQVHALYTQPKPPDFFGWVVGWLDLRPGHLVLDAGCGNGAFHAALSKTKARITALDQSPELIAAALQGAPENARLRAVCAWIEAIPFAARAFDAVMVNFVLHHIRRDRLPAVLRELHRVLKPGGRLVVSAHSATQYGRLRDLHAAAAREHGFTPRTDAFGWFTLDDLDLMRTAFPDARVEAVASSLVIPTPDIVAKYYSLQMVDLLVDVPADGRHRAPLVTSVHRRTQSIIASEGSFSDLKTQGCFVASRT